LPGRKQDEHRKIEDFPLLNPCLVLASGAPGDERLAHDLVDLMNEVPEILRLMAPAHSAMDDFVEENGCGVTAWQDTE
jgi:hypothetical protein